MSNDKDSLNMSDLTSALNEEGRAGLVNAPKNKLQNLAGPHSYVLENLTPTVRKRVEVLREIQNQYDEMEEKFFEERALEAKYQKLYQPLYPKQNNVWWKLKVHRKKERSTSFLAYCITAEEVTERDEGALKYLKDIKWNRVEEPKGFKLEFLFDQNTYFKNTVLSKTYHMIDEDEPILEKAIGFVLLVFDCH
ncbi:unnamed protein product [Microthlaspi erraticum]|uniref:Uncharacterized protein n=1 Tax=Microthlaspi erraticum TaxID=1685480 RepID=A0A6D2KZU1_9BRAS|nr:unnamed protein product [Microthlaspi erraticum]